MNIFPVYIASELWDRRGGRWAAHAKSQSGMSAVSWPLLVPGVLSQGRSTRIPLPPRSQTVPYIQKLKRNIPGFPLGIPLASCNT